MCKKKTLKANLTFRGTQSEIHNLSTLVKVFIETKRANVLPQHPPKSGSKLHSISLWAIYRIIYKNKSIYMDTIFSFHSRTCIFKADFKSFFKFSRLSENTGEKKQTNHPKTLEKTFPWAHIMQTC